MKFLKFAIGGFIGVAISKLIVYYIGLEMALCVSAFVMSLLAAYLASGKNVIIFSSIEINGEEK